MWLLSALLIFLPQTTPSFVEDKLAKQGFFNLYWDANKGTLYMAIDRLNEPFLYVPSLASGLGSNDIGLDRGRLGQSMVVHFERVGKRVFLVQPNLTYRAISNNPAEVESVRESFASATLWSTEIVAEESGRLFIDLGSLALRDNNSVAAAIEFTGQGRYALDKDRSRYVIERTKSFPDNTEVEVSLTFVGEPKGDQVALVAANAQAPTLNQRISFIRLPEPGYEPRPFHPAGGGIDLAWYDYAAPLEADQLQLYSLRHRLRLANAATGEVVEPIVYYVDCGAPAEIRDALIEGASWWAQAFEAAGFKNAFEVKVMPPDMDPMDVRYNVIQWVHRATRGWSYGSSIYDPRTGEIIKGQVTLGSLRVRQDRLLFEGMVPRAADGTFPAGQDPSQLALARIRQLSAHEVGHTIGLAHNFIASTQGRASVMDYPAPLVRLKEGRLDLSDVYDRGIGAWDKVAVRCLYGEFEQPASAIEGILAEAGAAGLTFIADDDSRSASSLHPDSHLWDNGADALDEMDSIQQVRRYMIERFGPANMASDRMQARLEETFVPIYLHHRYQLEAVSRSLGGARFDYGPNDGGKHLEPVPLERQRRALELCLGTLTPEFLQVPPKVVAMIPPRPPGYYAHREMFDRRTGGSFDPLALVETSAQLTLDLLLESRRLNRIFDQQLTGQANLTVNELLDRLCARFAERPTSHNGVLQRQVNHQVFNQLIALVGEASLREEVRALIAHKLAGLVENLPKRETDPHWQAHAQWLRKRLEHAGVTPFTPSSKLKTPPGSPI